MQLKVFISYGARCQHSKALISVLKAQLGRDYSFIYDEEQLRAGDVVPERIDFWLRDCDAAIFLLSEAALASRWVAYEARRLANRRWSDQRLVLVPVGVAEADGQPTHKVVSDTSAFDGAVEAGFANHKCAVVTGSDAEALQAIVDIARTSLPRPPRTRRQRAERRLYDLLSPAPPSLLEDMHCYLGSGPTPLLGERLRAAVARRMVDVPLARITEMLKRIKRGPWRTHTPWDAWQHLEPLWLNEQITDDFAAHGPRQLRSYRAAATVRLLFPASYAPTVEALQTQFNEAWDCDTSVEWHHVPASAGDVSTWLSDRLDAEKEYSDAALLKFLGCGNPMVPPSGPEVSQEPGIDVVVLVGCTEPRALQNIQDDHRHTVVLLVQRKLPQGLDYGSLYRLRPPLTPEDEYDGLRAVFDGRSLVDAIDGNSQPSLGDTR